MADNHFTGYPFHAPGQFQRQVYPEPAPGVEGDFADHNPRSTVTAGPGGLVAGPEGIAVGRFAWLEYSRLDPNLSPVLALNHASDLPDGVPQPAGFIHREQQGIVASWLGGASMWIPPGFPVTIMDTGAFFVVNRGDAYGQIGMTAYADLANGGVMFGPSTAGGGTNPFAATITGAIVAAQFTGTGSVNNNTLHVDTVTSAGVPLVPGAQLTMTGVPPGVSVTRQLSGDFGAEGRYTISQAGLTIPPGEVITGDYGILTVTGVTTGTIAMGAIVNPGPPMVRVTAFGTGTGNVGTYYVNSNAAAAVTSASAAVETRWRATSANHPGGLIKITTFGSNYQPAP
jgi:hypothetical protein